MSIEAPIWEIKMSEEKTTGADRIKKWRIENPDKNREQRKKYKQSENGKTANKKYQKKHREKPEVRKNRNEYNKKPEVRKKINEHNKKPEIRKKINEHSRDKYNQSEKIRKKQLKRVKDLVKLKLELIKCYGGCQECSSKDNLEMHHKNYEDGGIVLLLCNKCHRHLHMTNEKEVQQDEQENNTTDFSSYDY